MTSTEARPTSCSGTSGGGERRTERDPGSGNFIVDNGGSSPSTIPPISTGGGSTIKKHYMIQASNYGAVADARNYPVFVYGFATDPALKSSGGDVQRFIQQVNISGAIAKMLIFSSAASAEKYLGEGTVRNSLRNAGVDWIGYNQEGDKTPSGEFSEPYNAVIRFARATQQHGYKFIWGPLRHMLDHVDSGTIQRMCQAGMNGIAIQEQNQVQGDGSNRIQPVLSTIRNYRNACGSGLYTTVQTMWGQGGNCSNGCAALVQGIRREANSISLWANRDKAGEISRVFNLMRFFLGE